MGNIRREVIAYTDEGVEAHRYPSMTDACKALGTSRQGVRNSVKYGWRAGGYRWKYGQEQPRDYKRNPKKREPRVIHDVPLEAVLELVGDEHATSLKEYVEQAKSKNRRMTTWRAFGQWYVLHKFYVPSDTLVAVAVRYNLCKGLPEPLESPE